MTDRELLEMAAKGAGYYFHGHRSGCGNCYVSETNDTDDWFVWSPLTDDGDALRLAVRLGLQIQPYPLYAEPKYAVLSHKGILVDGEPKYTHGFSCVYEDDPVGATRRAIVLAAAEIGGAMP